MPWNNPPGGKGGNGGPWGQPPRNSGSGGPTDLEELLRRGQDRLRRVLPGGGRNVSPLTLIAILVVAAAFIVYNFFTFRVQPDEVGVVLRFGNFDREAKPGLNFRLPYPIEVVYTPKVTRVNRVNVGQVSDDNTGGTSGRDIPEESLMLTGDENIVNIDFSVFWLINDASKYLFNMEDPDGTVKAVAESAMREVVGRSDIQPLLTQGKALTERQVQDLIQKTLDTYNSGVQITQVQLLRVDPPDEVVASFRDVQAAQADQVRVQNEAQTYANKVVPEARGQASQITNAASAYRDRIVAEAQGQADRFSSVYQSYKAAPVLTRRRMYIETMEQIIGGMDKVIIDTKSNVQGVVPYLPLDRLAPASGTVAAPSSNNNTATGQSVTSGDNQ